MDAERAEIQKRAKPGSLDLDGIAPGRFFWLVVNVGLYVGVVAAVAVVLALTHPDAAIFISIAAGYFVISVPGLLLFLVMLGHLPARWPLERLSE